MLFLQPEIEASQAVKSDIIRETIGLVLYLDLLKPPGVLHYWGEHSFPISPQNLNNYRGLPTAQGQNVW
ncbi:hypothetical protein G6F42_015877 [Rhizopus arrhizus]|nr:hypothetical protein G6F42_015877 [Rhizopus arrhizus]